MTKPPKPDQVCIGLSIEGDLLRLATVGREGRNIRVLDLACMTLPALQAVPASTDTGETPAGGADPFDGFDTDDATEGPDFSSVREFLHGHYVQGASLAISMGEPYIRTFLTSREAKESAAKVLKRILEEAQHTLNVELTRDMVAWQSTGPTSIVAAARVEATPLLEVFAEPQGVQRRPTRINLVTSNDVALMNLVRVHFRFNDEEVVHVINVGRDETKLMIMRGGELRFIAPMIQQGAADRDFVTMLNNRIELAAENAGYPKADTVVLAGFAEEIGLKEEILVNNPHVVFHSLSRLRVQHGDDETILRELRHYSVPISVAWEMLQPKSPHFLRITLIPRHIRDEQKSFRLAWHGYLLLLLLFVSTVAMTVMILDRQSRILTEGDALRYEQRQVAEQKAIVDQISALETRSAAITTATNTLDTLLLNGERWSETLDTLAQATSALGNIWVSEMKPEKEGGMTVIGYSLTRASVPAISHRIGTTTLREISVQEIGQKKLFRYDINLQLEDRYPSAGSPAAVWHDSVTVALGDVSTRFASVKKEKAETKGKKKPAKKAKKGDA